MSLELLPGGEVLDLVEGVRMLQKAGQVIFQGLPLWVMFNFMCQFDWAKGSPDS